ncbi:MAG: hypothetical protein SFV21_02320 [Rhodospirillaceae bacterium]|nr:hypothetical protein [Rhodospirillaceae bacterium]
MISTRQMAAALTGLWLVLKLEPAGLAFFERNLAGFWRSYVAALILAPLNLLHVVLDFPRAGETLAFTPYLITQALAYVLSWTAYPFAMLYVLNLLDREARFFEYMVPYNWFQLAVGLVVFPISLLFDVGLLSAPGAAFLQLLTLGLFMSYATFLARLTLNIVLSSAFALVVFDILLNLLINQVVARI